MLLSLEEISKFSVDMLIDNAFRTGTDLDMHSLSTLSKTPGISEANPKELAAKLVRTSRRLLLWGESERRTGTSASIASNIVLHEPPGELSK